MRGGEDAGQAALTDSREKEGARERKKEKKEERKEPVSLCPYVTLGRL